MASPAPYISTGVLFGGYKNNMTKLIKTTEVQRLIMEGMRHFATHTLSEAAGYFEHALALAHEAGSRPSPRLLSYCGYTTALVRKKYEQGLNMCELAVEQEYFNPELFCNLADVYLACGDKAHAHQAFNKGLAMNPGHVRIRDRLREMGIRRQPVVQSLARDHFINRSLGRFVRSRARKAASRSRNP